MHTAFIVLMMEAVCTSETSVYFNETIQHYIKKAVIISIQDTGNSRLTGLRIKCASSPPPHTELQCPANNSPTLMNRAWFAIIL
jgi:hypothetical protein